MSENTLIKKIKQEAEAKAEAILAVAATEVEAIERETKSAVAVIEAEQKTALEKEKSHRELVAVSKAKQAGNIALQQAKRSHIDSVFSEAHASIIGLSGSEYVAFFKAKAEVILPEKVEAAAVKAPADKSSETAEILKSFGVSANVEADNSIDAGFILKTTDGVYDVTLRRLFAENRESLEMEVVNKITI
tara:strand:+ start:917 stop:1486 length:570 start_codon:yes stop_codon:yes gene_type:complete